MKIWLIFDSIGLLFTATMLYLTIRQVGLILGRLGPIGARSSADVGPRVGENLSPLLDPLDLPIKNGKPTLYIFGSDSCGICSKIKPAATSLMKYWAAKSNIVMLYDLAPKNSQNRQDLKEGDVPIFRGDIRESVGIPMVPFAVMANPVGVVLGKGLVNEMSHLESLLELTQIKN
jgi:methylamine dehydrogenase accessory protein MauD